MLLLLVSGFGLKPIHANVPALLAGLVVQFVGNKYWAFRDPSPALARQLALFSLVEVGALALNAAMFHGLVAGLGAHAVIARGVCSAAVYVGFSLPWWRRIFRGEGSTGSTGGG
jgi:putative flippase GtrA